ncbi:MAG: hypothetical protein V1872_01715 [bacterium]
MQKQAKYLVIVGGFIILALSSHKALAELSPQMANEVVNYYFNGQEEGPILMEAKLCKTIENRECTEDIDPKSIVQGEVINVWMKFLVPKDASYDDIFIEYKYEGTPRQLTPYKVDSSIRYRVVDTFRPNKLGEWTITIKRGVKELKQFTIDVVEKKIETTQTTN